MKIKIVVLFIVSLFILQDGTVSAQNWDINLLKDINLNRNKNADPFFKGISNSVYPIMGMAPTSILLHGYFAKDSLSIRNGLLVGVSIAFGLSVTYGLKYGINRTRPYLTYPILDPATTETSASFPSGHTSTAFSTATAICLCYPKWYIITPMFLWASTIGYSRMHLGVHYPSDVIGGAIIGSGCAFLSFKLNKWMQKRTTNNSKKSSALKY